MKTLITHPNFFFLKDQILTETNIFNSWNVDFWTFPDGWPQIFFQNIEQIKNQEIVYIADFSKPEYVFENYSIIRSLFLYQAKKIDIFTPFFPVGTMERIIEIWEVATSKYFADILSLLPIWNTRTTLHIFDIHSLEQRFFFNDFNVSVELHTCMWNIKNIIDKNTTIVFPDQWAKKRFSNEFEWYETLYCAKQRIWEKRVISLLDGDVNGKNILIVDDLIQTGWTIINTSILLKKLWANTVSSFATHWVFPNESYQKLSENLDFLYTTDSIPSKIHNLKIIKNIKILSISNNIIKICEN